MSYVSSYGDRPPDPNRKYGRDHWSGCLCEACFKAFENHAARNGNYCPCVHCESTRQAIFKAKESQAEILPVEREKVETMSTVNLCDRCGTMGKSKAMGTVVIVPVNEKADVFGDAVRTLTGKVERMELCPGCVGELMAWKDAEGGTRPKAYSEPWEPPKDDALPTDSTTLFRLALEASKRETFGDEKSDD